MSTLKKIFLGLSIVLMAVAGVLAFFLQEKTNNYATHLTDVERILKNPDKLITISYSGDFRKPEDRDEPAVTIKKYANALKDKTEAFNSTSTELDDTKKKLSDIQGQVNTLQVEAADEKHKYEDAKAQLDPKVAQIATLQQQLGAIKDSLKGENPADLFSSIDTMKKQLDSLKDDNKKLEETSASLKKKVDDLTELDNNRKTHTVPSTLSGRVVAVNHPWSFVVLDIGKKDKLVENIELTVYRGDKYIGKIRTVSVEDNTAVADILPGWQQGEVQVGDQVLF